MSEHFCLAFKVAILAKMPDINKYKKHAQARKIKAYAKNKAWRATKRKNHAKKQGAKSKNLYASHKQNKAKNAHQVASKKAWRKVQNPQIKRPQSQNKKA